MYLPSDYTQDPRHQTVEMEELTELNMDFNAPKPDPVYLRREKDSAPGLMAQKHPHGTSPPSAVHPASGQGRALTYGNDNSSVNRQSRSQAGKPDPIAGEWCSTWLMVTQFILRQNKLKKNKFVATCIRFH